MAKQKASSSGGSGGSGGGSAKLKQGNTSTSKTASALTNLTNNVANAITNAVNGGKKKSVVETGVSTSQYNKILASARSMYNTTNGKGKNTQFVKDYLASSDLSTEQIKKALKSLGIK